MPLVIWEMYLLRTGVITLRDLEPVPGPSASARFDLLQARKA